MNGDNTKLCQNELSDFLENSANTQVTLSTPGLLRNKLHKGHLSPPLALLDYGVEAKIKRKLCKQNPKKLTYKAGPRPRSKSAVCYCGFLRGQKFMWGRSWVRLVERALWEYLWIGTSGGQIFWLEAGPALKQVGFRPESRVEDREHWDLALAKMEGGETGLGWCTNKHKAFYDCQYQ